MTRNPQVDKLARKVVRRLARAAEVPLAADAIASNPSGDAKVPPKLLFVLGSQRSGTNALRQSLSLDPWVMGFNERETDRWYVDWQLKPEPKIRNDLHDLPSRVVLFKPIVNMKHEPVGEWLRQWDDYEVQVVWIYREPVDVFQSRAKHWEDKADIDDFLAEWHRVNLPLIDAIDDDGRISLVRYGDLARDKTVFWGLCRRLGVHGENLFRAGPSKGRDRLENDQVESIVSATRDLMHDLDRRRTFLPTLPVTSEGGDVTGAVS